MSTVGSMIYMLLEMMAWRESEEETERDEREREQDRGRRKKRLEGRGGGTVPTLWSPGSQPSRHPS